MQIEDHFQPGWGLRNGHLQTIFSRGVYSRRGIIFERRRLDTPDGDFIDLDFPEIPGFTPADDAPLVLVLHGLEGSARAKYALESYIHLAARGLRAVGMNFRSCSGEINRATRFYHAGETTDLTLVYSWLRERFPEVPKGIIGFSLGANLLLKFIGEREEFAPPDLVAAAAVSPPFDLITNSYKMAEGVNRLYSEIFLRELRGKVRQKADILSAVIDVEGVLAATNIRQFDEWCTAPLNGYLDADDYYQQNSSRRFLNGIRLPTLIIRALDDPLFEPRDIPHEAIGQNPFLHALFPLHGGHVAFIQGKPGTYNRWAEKCAAHFICRQVDLAAKP